jgi:hypothetical protein
MTRLRPADIRRAIQAGLLDPLDLAPPEGINERSLTSLVIAIAQGLGWRVYHPRPAMERSGRWCTPTQGDVGYPDLTLVKNGRLLCIELKTSVGRVSPDQREWLSALDRVHDVETAVIRPSEWGELVKLLQGE